MHIAIEPLYNQHNYQPQLDFTHIFIGSHAVTWLFLDETLVKDKRKIDFTLNYNENGNPSDETNASDNSSDSPYSNDSDIELLQPEIASSITSRECESTLQSSLSNSNQLAYQEDEESSGQYTFEIDDSEADTGSDYDISSDTELLQNQRTKKQFNIGTYFNICKNFFQDFSIMNLFRLVVLRVTDCFGGLVTCVECLWNFDCKPYNLGEKTSGCSRSFIHGIIRTIKLILDRKVFLSTFLYGVIAFLTITLVEVICMIL